MEIIDVSVPVRPGMPHYPSDPSVQLELVRSLSRGDPANVVVSLCDWDLKLDFGVHSGTHVDAPGHFFEAADGADQLPLTALVGPADVVDATAFEEGAIDANALSAVGIPDDCERLLLKTRNGRLWERDEFSDDFVSLDASGARDVAERGIVLVGIDYLSIGDEDAHRELLGAGIVALEGLDLREVDPGDFELICLPLRLEGSDGAPCRAILAR